MSDEDNFVPHGIGTFFDMILKEISEEKGEEITGDSVVSDEEYDRAFGRALTKWHEQRK